MSDQPNCKSITKRTAGGRAAHRSAFEAWWYNEGSGMPPQPGEDAETHVHRICKIAWSRAVSAKSTPVAESPKSEIALNMKWMTWTELPWVARGDVSMAVQLCDRLLQTAFERAGSAEVVCAAAPLAWLSTRAASSAANAAADWGSAAAAPFPPGWCPFTR